MKPWAAAATCVTFTYKNILFRWDPVTFSQESFHTCRVPKTKKTIPVIINEAHSSQTLKKTEAFSINLPCAWNAFVKSLCQPLTFSLFHSLLPAGQLRMRSAGEDPRKQLEWKEQAGEPSVLSRAGLEETIRPPGQWGLCEDASRFFFFFLAFSFSKYIFYLRWGGEAGQLCGCQIVLWIWWKRRTDGQVLTLNSGCGGGLIPISRWPS